MRFKQFIIEQAQLNERASSEGDFAIEGLGDEEWVNWVVQRCSDYLPRAARFPIYRGFKNEAVELGIKDTSEFTRRSANTYNYFTLWLDNAPQWKEFPRRLRSFIGTSNFYTAKVYGELYQLFPANDAKIGICPKKDIWYSFSQIPGGNVANLNDLLQITFTNAFGWAVAERAETDWAELRRLLEGITTGEFIDTVRSKLIKSFTAPTTFTRYSTLFDYFENEITPEKHNFKHATPATYSVTSTEDKEVWVQGKVALLNVDFIFNSSNNYRRFPKTLELLSKHGIEKSL